MIKKAIHRWRSSGIVSGGRPDEKSADRVMENGGKHDRTRITAYT